MDFQNKYHLQSGVNASINLGLFYKNELIGVMTFGRPRFNREYQYELIRIAYKAKTVVVGGSEKLFKHFIKKYNPVDIISYCDISKFTGRIYKKLGFEFNGYTEPSYVWVNGKNDVLQRYQTMKYKLIDKLGLDKNTSFTERDITETIGYFRVYNCGNARYIWKRY